MPQLIRKVKLPAYTKSDIWVLLAIVPAQVIICNRILLGPTYFHEPSIFITATVLFFLHMFLVFQLCGLLALQFLKIYPSIEQTPKRMVIATATFICLTVLSLIVLVYIYNQISFLRLQSSSYFNIKISVISALGSLIITIIFEGLAAFERWKTTLFETEQLKKENLKSQLLSLKNQVNPHFLFNNINSLSALISEEPDKAEHFLDEMSKVYRYLLRNNDDNLVSLKSELQFIRSYFHLLKMRYGPAIELQMDVSAECSECLLPPLTLQILLENAIKHNIISKDHPLFLEIICTNNEQLMIRNNIQMKNIKNEPSGTGLENIAAKYNLLSEPDIRITQNAEHFSVTIPLITRNSSL